MARTTATAVKGVLLSDYGTTFRGLEPDLGPFIEAAGAMVDDLVDCATAKSLTVTTARRELLERWLAAHFYSCTDRPYQSRSEEGASATFQGQTGKGLEASYYGQTAIRLDSTGCLAAAEAATEDGGRPTVSFAWLGKNPTDQTDYLDRR